MSMQKKSEAMQLNLFGEEKEHTKSPLTITTLLTLFRESFIAEGYESEEHRKKALERGKKALEHWYNWWKKEE